jgi:protoporphyrinogen oxidase
MSKYICRIIFNKDISPNIEGNLGYCSVDSIFDIKEIIDDNGKLLALYETPLIINHWSDNDLRIFYTWMDIKCNIQFTDQQIEEKEIEEWVDIYLANNGLERMLFLELASKIYGNDMNDLSSFDAYNGFVEAMNIKLFKKVS